MEVKDPLLTALLGKTSITRDAAMDIPSVAACVKLITETAASVPIKLYKEDDKEVKELEDDRRVALINDETGDLLDGIQMKEAWIEDYLLDGNGYIYIDREWNETKSLRYIPSNMVSVDKN